MIEIRGFRDLLRLLFIFSREFRWAFLATLVVVVLGAFLLPTRYVSDARLLVKPTETASVQLPVQPGPEAGFVQQSPQRDPLLDEEKLATSTPVMQRVAKAYLELSSVPPEGGWARVKFKLGKAAAWAKETVRDGLVLVRLMDPAPPADRLAARMAKRLSVGHDSGSNVMEMRVTWGDPQIAQAISRAWVDAYFDERAKAAGGDALFDFYMAQSNELNESIAALKRQMRGQLREIDATSVEQRIVDVTDQLQQLYRQRRDLMAQRQALSGIVQVANRQLPRVDGEVVTDREISLNPARQDLQLKYNSLQAQRLELLRTYTPGAPAVLTVEQSILELGEQIARLDEMVVRSRNLSPNSLGVRLRQDRQDAQVAMGKIDANVAELDAQILALQQERETVMAAEPSLTRLSLELSTAERAFAQYSDYLLRARVIRDLNRHRLSNVALVGESSYTPSRVFPKSMLMLALVLPVALAVAAIVVFVLYLMDQRIHDGGRIEPTFGVPVLATLPELDPGTDAAALRAGLLRLYCRLPLAQVASSGLTIGLTSNQRGEGVRFVAAHLRQMLARNGHAVVDGDGCVAGPGEVVVRAAPPLSQEGALLALRDCGFVVLVVQARRTTVPAVENALATLRGALGRADGIVLNRRVYEIPQRVWGRAGRWLGVH